MYPSLGLVFLIEQGLQPVPLLCDLPSNLAETLPCLSLVGDLRNQCIPLPRSSPLSFLVLRSDPAENGEGTLAASFSADSESRLSKLVAPPLLAAVAFSWDSENSRTAYKSSACGNFPSSLPADRKGKTCTDLLLILQAVSNHLTLSLL